MKNSYWESENTIKKNLKINNFKEGFKYGGLPVIHDGNNIYVSGNDGHSLIVGATGSGKTQSTILPSIKVSLLADESVIVNDPKGEIYKQVAYDFKERGYNVIVLDMDNCFYGNYWNPLTLPYTLYKEGNKDKALTLLESIGYYLFTDNINKDVDPFWINSVIDCFSGICLYLFSKGEEPTLNNIFDLMNSFTDDKNCKSFLNEIGKSNTIYYNVSGSLESPIDTRGGIIATFNQKIKKYISRENLSEVLSKSDFDIEKIASERTALFIVSGFNEVANNLIPLLINQVFDAINIYGNNNRYLSILLDEFDKLLPIKDFANVINFSRGLKIRFTVVIKSYIDLLNTYGENDLPIIYLCFSNLIYLYANDITTLEKISKICGYKYEKNISIPLINVEELKTFDRFEAIILIPRCKPFRTKLIPNYKLEWNLSNKEIDLEKRK